MNGKEIVQNWVNQLPDATRETGYVTVGNYEALAHAIDAAVEVEREKADRVILSCYRAFRPSSDYVKNEAKRLVDEWVKEMEASARKERP